MATIMNFLTWYNQALLTDINLAFLTRFLINLASIFVISKYIYFKKSGNREYLFVMFIFNIITFFVCFLMSNTKLSVGFGFGVFAIFSILRYRTTLLPLLEMTFIFICISLGLINSLTFEHLGIELVVAINITLFAVIFILNRYVLIDENSKTVIYERIELINEENRSYLIEDLRKRCGLDVIDVKVMEIDFVKDCANLLVIFRDDDTKSKPSKINNLFN